MIDIAILRAMAAAGATVDVIITAVELAQAPEVNRRAKDAERKRLERARPRMSEDVHGRHRTVQDTNGHIIERKKVSKKESKKERKISIAADWSPSEDDRAYARSEGWDDQRIGYESKRFHNHYLANGERRASWPACWRKWVTSPYQQPQKNGNGDEKSIVAACDRFIAQNGGMEAAREYVPGSSGPAPLDLDRLKGQASPRLISSR